MKKIILSETEGTVKLIFRGSYRLSRTGIVECLEIIDVGCNLKQFVLLTLTPIF